MKHALVVLLAFMFSVKAEAGAETLPPEIVLSIATETVYLLCTRVEMDGVFYKVNDTQHPTDHEELEGCGNAVQFSATEVLTAAHVLVSVQDIIWNEYSHKLEILARHGFVPGFVPERVDEVRFSRALLQRDGKRIASDTLHFSAQWAGAFNEQNVHAFIASLTERKVTPSTTTHRMSVAAKDPAHDLGRVVISPPVTGKTFLSLEPSEVRRGDAAWSIAAVNSPDGNKNTRAVIIPGYVYSLWGGSEIEQGQASNIRTVRTTYPTRSGYSGGPVITSDGHLIGVTQASTEVEMTWSFDLPYPCDVRFPCQRFVVSEEDVRKFLRQ